jgi:hypothetical protein
MKLSGRRVVWLAVFILFLAVFVPRQFVYLWRYSWDRQALGLLALAGLIYGAVKFSGIAVRLHEDWRRRQEGRG